VSAQIGVPSPLKITINSMDLVQPSGSIDLNVEVMETMPDIQNVKIRVVLLENTVVHNTKTYTDVTGHPSGYSLSVSGLGRCST